MAYAFLRQELQEIHLKGKIVNLTALLLDDDPEIQNFHPGPDDL
jgi:hypothetical protein